MVIFVETTVIHRMSGDIFFNDDFPQKPVVNDL